MENKRNALKESQKVPKYNIDNVVRVGSVVIGRVKDIYLERSEIKYTVELFKTEFSEKDIIELISE